MSPRIDQVVPSFGGRDAIGTHILLLRDLLRDLGFESDVWCKGSFPETRAIARFTDDLPGRSRPDTWWLYHLSSGSPVAELIAERPEPKMVDYHNVTPGELLRQLGAVGDPGGGGGSEAAQDPCRRIVVCDSPTRISTLRTCSRPACRDERTLVVPPLFDPHAPRSVSTRAGGGQTRRARGGGADWLFVGRVTPSKAQDDLIKALAIYRQVYDPEPGCTWSGPRWATTIHVLWSAMREDSGWWRRFG